MADRRAYDTDLTDAEWDRWEPLVPAAKSGGRPRKHTRCEIVNGICYAIRSGGAWKMLVCSQNSARRVRALQGRLEMATGNKRLARISDDAIADGWFRRYRTQILSRCRSSAAITVLDPGR